MDSRASTDTRKVRRALLAQIAAACICFALPLTLIPLAQSEESATRLWEPLVTWEGDSTVQEVILAEGDDREVLYSVGAVSGVHTSPNGGRDWVHSRASMPRDALGVVRVVGLAVNPEDPSEAHAVVASPATRPRPMVYFTQDAGLTWQVRGSVGARRVRAIAFGPTSDSLYMVAGGDVLRVFVSEGGRRRFIDPVADLDAAQVGSCNPLARITALAIGGGLLESSESEAVSARKEGERPPLALYVGSDGNGLQIVLDDPSQRVASLPISDDPVTLHVRTLATIHAICIHPQRPEIICLGTDRGVYASTDAGRSWFRTAHGLRAEKVLSLLFDPSGNAFYAGVVGGGVLCSTDSGATWHPAGKGLGHASVFSLAIGDSGDEVASSRRTLYAGTDDGLWRLSLLSD